MASGTQIKNTRLIGTTQDTRRKPSTQGDKHRQLASPRHRTSWLTRHARPSCECRVPHPQHQSLTSPDLVRVWRREDTRKACFPSPKDSLLPAAGTGEEGVGIRLASAGQPHPLVVATGRCKDTQTKGEPDAFLPFPESLYAASIKHLLVDGPGPCAKWTTPPCSQGLLNETHTGERQAVLPQLWPNRPSLL